MYLIANATGSLFWTGTKFSRDAAAAKPYDSEAGAKRACPSVSAKSGRARLVVMGKAEAEKRSA